MTVTSCCCIAMLTIFILLLLSVTLHAKIDVTPMAPLLHQGSNISFNCSIVGESQHTTQDITWYHNSDKLPTNTYSAINTTVSTLSLTNVTFSDGGVYVCCIAPDHCNHTQLRVGVPPGPVQDLHCISRNTIEYWCKWKPGAQTYLPVTYQFYYSKNSRLRDRWKKCVDNWSKGANSCYVSFAHNLGTQQKMKVTSTNDLGIYDGDEDIIYFDPGTQAIPNTPSHVDVQVAVDNPSTRLQVTWGLPDEWRTNLLDQTGKTLRYKLRYKLKQEDINWRQHETASFEQSYVLPDLLPFNEYCVQVAAKVMFAPNNVDYWSEWSEIKCALTAEGAPSGTINIDITETYDSPGNKSMQRDVILQWNDMPFEHQNGIILGYVLYVRKSADIAAVPQVYNTSLKSQKLKGLDKFTEYVVYIHAFNMAGAGPNSTCKIPDLTTSPGSSMESKPVAMVTVDYCSCSCSP